MTAVDERGLESRPVAARFRTPERAVPEATLPRTASAPTVDSIDEGWGGSDIRAVEKFLWGDSLPEITAEWRALWDEAALYVLVAVTDTGDGKRDADIELYFDPDNSHGTTYDGENDLQMVVPRGTEMAVAGSNSAPIVSDTEVETVETDDEWRTMLAVPWANYGVRPVVGHRFGMDVHIALKNRGERTGKLSWFDESDSAWQNPEQFATIELGE